jgi:hypothetical protein
LSIARLSPKGRVVLTDLAAEMLDVAARRAKAQGIANIETKVCSDDLPFNDATFDSVSVRFGTCSSLTWPGDGRVRPRAQAGRMSLLVGMGSEADDPVGGGDESGDIGWRHP